MKTKRKCGRRCQFPEGTVRVNLLVSPETYAALDRRARAEGHSISQEARAALDSAQGLNSRIDALLRTIECRDAKIAQLNRRLNKATDELKALKADQPVAPTEAR